MEAPQRTLDKFVVRMPDGLRSKLTALAATRYTSMNSLMVEAATELVNGYTRLNTLVAAVEARKVELEGHAKLAVLIEAVEALKRELEAQLAHPIKPFHGPE